LHHACSADSSNEKIDFLINKYPAALTVYNEEGYLPFQRACLDPQYKATEVTKVEYLIKRMGLSTLPPTKAGVHPLLKACENNVALDFILKLVQHSPEWLQVKLTSDQSAHYPFKKRRVLN
jgi:hypothetical protein